MEVPCADPDGLATCYLAAYPGGSVELVFADDAPEEFVDRARRIDTERFLARTADVAAELGATGIMRCSTYAFIPPIADITGSATLGRTGPEAVSASVEGQLVAEAVSSRSDAASAELWVRTEPAHRRRGYGAQVASSWAGAVTAAGKVAFYSHLAANDASRSLAAHLNVRPLFELVGLSIPGPLGRTER